jgi:hypothetical protein
MICREIREEESQGLHRAVEPVMMMIIIIIIMNVLKYERIVMEVYMELR